MCFCLRPLIKMAEIVGTLLGPAMRIGSYLVAPIMRTFGYLCCFNNNIRSMRDEARNLDDTRAGLQMEVAAAENNAEIIIPEVETWLTSVNQMQVNVDTIENEIPNAQTSCLSIKSIKSRFSVSRRAKKAAEAVKELRNRCNFSHISVPAPPLAVESIPLEPTDEFDSRKQTEEEIMTALRDKVNMIGICGMGGVGKTTMVKRIITRAREEHLFDEVVMVVVTHQVDMSRLQLELAESLGLELKLKTLLARANKLHDRLTGKRILIVLDDIWERLKLEDLGIAHGSKGCTILFTSRDRGVLDAMDVEKVFEIQILDETEAWFLFKDIVGTCADDVNLSSTAKEVANQCKGLPIALVTVGRALKNKTNKPIWEDALQQLRTSNPIDMTQVFADVYIPLKVSYDLLESENAKSLFLLCSIFPEDHRIPMKLLTSYGVGLRMFEGIRNMEEASNKTCTLVDMLRTHFLLDGDDQYVRMHDIVRDTAIFIASKEGHINLNISSGDWWTEHSHKDCTWISVNRKESVDFPVGLGLNCPSLRLLLIEDDTIEDDTESYDHGAEYGGLDHSFFQGMEELNVLSLTSILSRSLPQTTQLLKKLRTLHLLHCDVEKISVVGELVSLEILTCFHCVNIEELPVEVGKLNRLRWLEISFCSQLRTIAPGVLSNLVELEELQIDSSFLGWEEKENGKQRKNAALSELEPLSKLARLQIEIEDCTLAAKDIRLPSNIVKHGITISAPEIQSANQATGRMSLELPRKFTTDRHMSLELPRKFTVGNWIHRFLSSTECLLLKGDGSNSLDLAQAQNVKFLALEFCSDMKKLVNTTSIDWRVGVFPLLESLYLSELFNLEEMCDGPIPEGSKSFGNLKNLYLSHLLALKHLWKSSNQNVSLCNLSSIDIIRCDNLRYLFSLTMERDGVLQLEKVKIEFCGMVEKLFWNEENEKDGEGNVTFPKMKELELSGLESLTTLCKGIESIEFPLLTQMTIKDCPKLISVVSSVGNDQNLAGSHGHDDDSFHLFCNQKVQISFQSHIIFMLLSFPLPLIFFVYFCSFSPINFFNVN
ncbi:hypothetical protein Pfo_000979 [Paulownia fortunei]|nr:hypothetical protein Pfo_000979 [Paulownia fortunei]